MTPRMCELRVFSRRHRFAGTLDVLGCWRGAGALIDYKTGVPADVATDLQTAAYLSALLEMGEHGDDASMLVFDETLHRYTLDGEPLPSVTGILQRAGLVDFSQIPTFVLAAARERGTKVHRAIHFYNEDDLDVAGFRDLFPDYWPYVAAWIKFRLVSGFRLATAAELGDLSHIKRYSVRLKRDEAFVVEPYTNPGDYHEFLALLRAQRIVERRKPASWDEYAEVA
jgi:hypothetical protein